MIIVCTEQQLEIRDYMGCLQYHSSFVLSLFHVQICMFTCTHACTYHLWGEHYYSLFKVEKIEARRVCYLLMITQKINWSQPSCSRLSHPRFCRLSLYCLENPFSSTKVLTKYPSNVQIKMHNKTSKYDEKLINIHLIQILLIVIFIDLI